jgi:hypothetical protein
MSCWLRSWVSTSTRASTITSEASAAGPVIRPCDPALCGVGEVIEEVAGGVPAAVAVRGEPVRHPGPATACAQPCSLRLRRKAAQEREADRDVELAEQPDHAGEVVLQHREQLVVHCDPVPDDVMAGAHGCAARSLPRPGLPHRRSRTPRGAARTSRSRRRGA